MKDQSEQVGRVTNGISGALVLPEHVTEADFKKSATNISDNTHTGEHWDGPKRGRIIRDYRKDLDSCNISGNGKCSREELAKLHPNGKA